MTSLRLRLLALTSLLLVASFALVGGAIDRSFLAALEQAQRDLLDSQIITLLAVAEPGDDRMLALPIDMPERRLNAPGSGLYASIRDETGALFWRSGSTLGIDVTPEPSLPAAGQRLFIEQTTSTGEVLQSLTLGVVWEFDDTSSAYFALSVAESRASLNAQMRRFRGQLYVAFGMVAITLLVAMAALLSLLLRPLGQIEREIEAVEAGELPSLSDNYPSELSGVARNLNTLLTSELRRVSRYQETLANLAHSLKTPLAAVQNLLHGKDKDPAVQAQLQRMESIVSYQLARPAAAGGRLIGRGAVPVLPEVEALLDGLDKVYRDKSVAAELAVDAAIRFAGDKGDLVELLGNLLDNAYKWCERRVLISARALPDSVSERKPGVEFVVEDDGPGFPEGETAAALERGTRLDESTPGTGIGLAVVRDLVSVYQGEVSISRSSLGGARIVVGIPPH